MKVRIHDAWLCALFIRRTLCHHSSHFLLLPVLCLMHLSTYAQVPPSPTASAQTKGAATPVNMYTGVPNIQVPLLTLPGRHMNVPIGLSYYAGGFKVQEISGPLGLGFSLQSGGVITRVVQGTPDDDEYGYSGPQAYGETIKSTELNEYFPSDLYDINRGERDGEPDVYYFNAMGRSGRFTLDAQRNAVLMPYQDVAIEVETNEEGKFISWTLTTEDGTVYRFGTDENARETTQAETIIENQENPPAKTFTSSWYLSQIESPGTDEKLAFTYESGGEVTYEYYNFVWRNGMDECLDKNGVISAITTRVTLQPSRRLKRIKSALGTVTFGYNHSRPDIAGEALTDMVLRDNSGQIKSDIKLYYDTFDGCYDIVSRTVPNADFEYRRVDKFNQCQRLKLTRIEDLTQVNSTLPPLYTFEYNTDTFLPDRKWGRYDDWGYANGDIASNKQAETFFDKAIIDGVDYGPLNNSNLRQVKASFGQAWLLTKLTQATGGYTTYQYEGHSQAGGVRIKSIEAYDGNSDTPTLQTTYDYHNSAQPYGSKPVYTWVAKTAQEDCSILIRYAQSLTNLFDLNGSALGYSKVSAVQRDGSRTTYRYTNFDEYSDKESELYLLYDFVKSRDLMFTVSNVNGQRRYYHRNQQVNPTAYDKPPYAPRESRSWHRGLPLEETHLNAIGDTVQSTNHYYRLNEALRKSVTGRKVEVVLFDNVYYDYEFYVGQYDMVSQPVFLDYTISKAFDQTNPGRAITTRTDYTYNEEYLTLKTTETTNSEGQTIVVEQKRAQDYNVDVHGRDLLIDKHMHSQVVEQITRLDGVRLNKTLTNYDQSNALVVPTIQWFSPSGTDETSPISIGTLMTYDTHGNIIQSQRNNNIDIPTAYLWGYNHSLKVAEVVGASYAEATSGLNLSVLEGNNTQALQTELNKLRKPGRLVTTYTYSPLTGMTTETDPAGITTYYEYDNLNRLQYVRDNQQKYVTRYQYHYQGQPHP